jgi:hypothetical protein
LVSYHRIALRVQKKGSKFHLIQAKRIKGNENNQANYRLKYKDFMPPLKDSSRYDSKIVKLQEIGIIGEIKV